MVYYLLFYRRGDRLGWEGSWSGPISNQKRVERIWKNIYCMSTKLKPL